MKSVLLFDLNNTIITSRDVPLPEYEEKLGVTQREFWSVYRTMFCDEYNRGKMSEDELYKRILDNLNAKSRDVELCKDLARKRRIMIPGVKEVLDSLKGKYRLVLFTGEGKEFLDDKMEQFGLGEYFPEVYATCDVGLLKFEPELYARILSDMELDPTSCIFIDDHKDFLDLAEGFDMRTILFKNAEALRKELLSLGIEF